MINQERFTEPEKEDGRTRPDFDHIGEHLKSYIHTTYELYRLKAIDKASTVSASVTLYLIVAVLALLTLVMISVGLAIWIGYAVGSLFAGFFIVAGIYIVVTLFLFLKKASVIRKTADVFVAGLMKD